MHLRSGWFDDTKIDHIEICYLLSISEWTKGIKLNDVLLYLYIGLSMSSDYDYIKDLKNDLDIWKIGFGVLDSWIVTDSNENQHMKLIICDANVRWVS